MILYWLLLSSTYLFHSSAEQCPAQRSDPAARPGPRHFEIYSKTKRCVYLRWMPPMDLATPVEHYYIEYFSSSSPLTTCTKNPSDFRIRNCEKWSKQNFICTGICKLVTNETYTFKVRAKYYDVNTIGTFSEPKTTIMRAEEPEPPRNLRFSWTDSELLLRWEHPFFPNGILRAFRIYIDGSMRHRYEIPKPNQTYTYRTNTEMSYPQIVDVSIVSINEWGRSKPATMTIARHEQCFTDSASSIRINRTNARTLSGNSHLYVYNREDSSLDCSNMREDDNALLTLHNINSSNEEIKVNGINFIGIPSALIQNENYAECYNTPKRPCPN